MSSKYYVVWKGKIPGIYETWKECSAQTTGFTNPRYKSFGSKEEAQNAFFGNKPKISVNVSTNVVTDTRPDMYSISVDAACSGNPGKMEYRGVWTETPEEEIFRSRPIEGTNNIGEFLAIVKGLKFLKKYELEMCLYTDSITAMAWVKNKKSNTTLKETEKTKEALHLLKEAEDWLKLNKYQTKILKWDTKAWGEIKADFGRK